MTEADGTLDQLRREVRRLRIAVIGMAAAGGAATLVAAVAPPGDARMRTLSVERINIVEPDGLYRAVLTNGARTPGPMKEARDGAPEGKRNFPFAGLILFDRAGQEQGGYGTGAAPGQGSIALTTLDWPGGRDGGFGEAIASYRKISAEGQVSSGIQLTDRPPAGEDPTDGVDHRRIKLQNMDRDAAILLADTNGRDRIRLGVDRRGEASIEILDAAGKPVFRAPSR